jgi:hypothetical protein
MFDSIIFYMSLSQPSSLMIQNIPGLLLSKQFLLSGIVAPHGITDIIHAHHHKTYTSLCTYYSSSILGSYLLSFTHHSDFLVAILCFASCFHFRRDFGFIKNNVIGYGCTIATIYGMIQYPNPLFYTYMCALHVPHHYYMARSYVKQYIPITLCLIIATGLVTYPNTNLSLSSPLFAIATGIILGHISYGETTIHNTE